MWLMSVRRPLWMRCLRTFMTSNNHMLIAHAAASTSYDGADIASTAVTGLITLEDVMETLMQVRELM